MVKVSLISHRQNKVKYTFLYLGCPVSHMHMHIHKNQQSPNRSWVHVVGDKTPLLTPQWL